MIKVPNFGWDSLLEWRLPPVIYIDPNVKDTVADHNQSLNQLAMVADPNPADMEELNPNQNLNQVAMVADPNPADMVALNPNQLAMVRDPNLNLADMAEPSPNPVVMVALNPNQLVMVPDHNLNPADMAVVSPNLVDTELNPNHILNHNHPQEIVASRTW